MSSIYDWSTTAASNGNSDAAINFAEGQAPSTLNNSNRQVMARVAELIDDLGSNVTVGGTANAITITANSAITVYSTGQRLVFKAGADNTGTTTLNVNSIGAKPIRKIGSDGDADLASGDLQAGSLYEVIYSEDLNLGAGGWQLLSPLPVVPVIDPTNYVPTGTVLPFAGINAPTGFSLCYGQAVSRTTFAALFAVISTTYGVGDGSTTFNLPDLRGRVVAGQDDMGGSSANRLTGGSGGVNGDTLGGTGGDEANTLTAAQIPAHTHTVSGTAASAGSHAHDVGVHFGASDGGVYLAATTSAVVNAFQATGFAGAHSHTVSGTAAANTGGGGEHNNVQPTIILNYIIRT